MVEKGLVKKYGRKPLLYALIMVILLGLTGLLQWVSPNDADTYFYFAQVSVLVLGIIHVLLFPRFITQLYPAGFWKGLILTILFMLAAVIAVTVAYYFRHLDYRFLTYILPFVLPYLLWQVFHYFFQIPSPVYKSWSYPLNEEMPDLDMIDLSQIEVVQFVFSKTSQDATQTNFTSKAPLNMTLGQLFFIFINDYNDKNVQQPIHFLKSADQPFEWFFYRKKKWFNKKEFLDPDLSFQNNSIQPNEFIYAYRVD